MKAVLERRHIGLYTFLLETGTLLLISFKHQTNIIIFIIISTEFYVLDEAFFLI